MKVILQSHLPCYWAKKSSTSRWPWWCKTNFKANINPRHAWPGEINSSNKADKSPYGPILIIFDMVTRKATRFNCSKNKTTKEHLPAHKCVLFTALLSGFGNPGSFTSNQTVTDVFITFQPFTLCWGWNQLITAGSVQPRISRNFQQLTTIKPENTSGHNMQRSKKLERMKGLFQAFGPLGFIELWHRVRDRKCPGHAHSKPPFLPRHVWGPVGNSIRGLRSRFRLHTAGADHDSAGWSSQPCFWLAAGTPACRVREIVRLCPIWGPAPKYK